MGKKSKTRIEQPPLLTPAEPEYLWLPVARLERNDLIVVADVEVKVQNITQAEGEWVISVVHLETREKAEQLYNTHDQVYVKATSVVKARLVNA